MLKLKIPPPAYMLIFAVSIWLLNQYFPIIHWIPSPWHKIGFAFIAFAFLLDFAAIILFFRQKTTPNPFKPNKASQLVTTGMYRFSRNPMYLGLLLLLTGEAIYLGGLSPFFLLPLFVFVLNKQQIKVEEKILTQKFEQQYLDYQQKVRRWL